MWPEKLGFLVFTKDVQKIIPKHLDNLSRYLVYLAKFPEEKSVLDKFDRDIIELLQSNGRLSFRELGDQVFLSANTVADRVRKLVADGAIHGFTARVNLHALNLSVQAIIDIKMLPQTSAREFESALRTLPGVVEALLLTGAFDYQLRVACQDQTSLVRLIESLRAIGVQDTHSRVILSEVIMAGVSA